MREASKDASCSLDVSLSTRKLANQAIAQASTGPARENIQHPHIICALHIWLQMIASTILVARQRG
jgi:hypothetical protein